MHFLEIQTLAPFSDRYRLMSVKQQVELANLFLKKSEGYHKILVIESGVSPIVYIMEQLLKRKNLKKEFLHVKIPREISPQNLSTVLDFYPTLPEFVSEPFLILDEYIDSGHTMKLFINLLNQIPSRANFRIMSYMNFCEDPDIKKHIHYACAENNSKEQIFKDNVFAHAIYPFENRLEYAPYFYYSSEKVPLHKFISNDSSNTYNNTLKSIYDPFLNKVKTAITFPEVARFISEHHLFLYSLYCKERHVLRRQFFWHLFDMIGPFWTPLPKEYHFAYWNAFEAIHDELSEALQDIKDIDLEGYAHQAAKAILQRYENWTAEVKTIILEDPC